MERWVHWMMLVGLGLAIALGLAFYLGDRTSSPTATSASSVYTAGQEDRPLAERWILNGEGALDLIRDGATVLDARGTGLHTPISGAIAARWQDFSQTSYPNQGKLLDDDAQLTERLQTLGISGDRPVIAIADPRKSWGEDGRIVWMLRTLGHPHAFIVDGGIQALQQAGLRNIDISPVQRGDFVVQRTAAWELSATDLQTQLQLDNPSSVVIIDARTISEFEGATPHREARGGHVPQAVHLHYRDLLDDQGYLLSREQIRVRLDHIGVQQTSAIASYCTGGIRSGWLTVVLADLGFNAKNYAGSMWEWSALPAEQYPLQ